MQQTAAEQENRHQRQRAGQRQQNTHINGGLDDLPSGGFQSEGVKPELAGVTRKPRQPRKERYGHKRRNDQQIKRLDSLYHHLQSFVDQIFVPLGGPSVDQFTQKSGQKQLNSENYGQNRQIKQWLVRNGPQGQGVALLPEFLGDDPHRRAAADEEHQRPEAAEEVHRRTPEMRHEQHRDQVQIPFHRAFEAKFRTAVLAGAMVDDLLADAAEPGLFGQERNEAVHLAVDLDGLHHLAAVGFQPAVEIVEPDARRGPGRPVEELAGPAFADGVVAALFHPETRS